MAQKSESYAAAYSAGYRSGIKWGQRSMEDRELVNLRKDTAHYRAGYKDGTKRALDDIKLHGVYKLAYKEGLKGANDDSLYQLGRKEGFKESLGKEGHEASYQAGYRAGSRTAPAAAVKDTLTRLMERVGKLGNHESVLMVKHEIRKELEAIKQKDRKVGLSL